MILLAYAVAILILLGLSGIGFWLKSSIVFMITAGVAIMTGLYSPRAFADIGEGLGISIGLMLIFYSFVCIALAYAFLFSKFNKKDDGSSNG